MLYYFVIIFVYFSADNRIIRYKNCKVLRGGVLEESDVWVRNGRVIDPMMVFFKERVLANVTINCNGLIASPGFIDLQVNGKLLKLELHIHVHVL